MPFLAWQIYLLNTWLNQTPTKTDNPPESVLNSETKIIESDMTPSMVDDAVEIAKMAFEKYSDKQEAASYIIENFDEKYGWEIIHFVLNYALEHTGLALLETLLVNITTQLDLESVFGWLGWG